MKRVAWKSAALCLSPSLIYGARLSCTLRSRWNRKVEVKLEKRNCLKLLEKGRWPLKPRARRDHHEDIGFWIMAI
jgi:hypothetical protein